MFSKTFIATLALVGAVSALPSPNGGSGTTTAPPQCCQNVRNSKQLDTAEAGLISALLGVVVSDLNVPIGTGCTPIAVAGGVSCNENTVQCGQVFEKELIGVDCVPVTANVKRGWTPPPPPSSCTTETATAQCCQNVENSSSVDSWTAGLLKGLLGVDVSSLNIPIGTGCTLVAVLGGVSCNQNVVCCGQDFETNLIGVNCVPVTANL